MKSVWLLALLMVFFVSTTTNAQNLQPSVITPENIQQLHVSDVLFRGQVTDAQWTPDGQTLVVAAATGLWLYDAEDYEADPRFLPATEGWIRSLAISSTGLVATGHHNGTITLWDVLSEEAVDSLSGHTWPVLTLDFSVDGTLLASGSGFDDCLQTGRQNWDSRVNVWNTDQRELQQSFIPEEVPPYELALSPDSSQLGITGDYGCYVDFYNALLQFIDLETGLQIEITNPYDDPWEAPVRNERIAYSPDGHWWVTEGQHGVLIYDTDRNEVYERNSDLGYNDLAFNPSGGEVAMVAYVPTCDADYDPRRGLPTPSIVLVETDTWEITACFAADTNLKSISYHPTEAQVVTIYYDQSVRVWDLETQSELAYLQGFTNQIRSIQFRPGTHELWGVRDRKLTKLNLDTGQTEAIDFEQAPSRIAFSPDGALMAYLMNPPNVISDWLPATLNLADVNTGETLWTVDQLLPNNDESTATDLAFTSDGMKLLLLVDSVFRLIEIQERDVATGEVIFRTNVEDLLLWEVAFSRDGQYAAAPYEDGMLLLDVVSGDILHELPGYILFSPQFSHDGRYVTNFAGQHNFPKTFMVWDAEDGALIIESSEIKVGTRVYSPDGRLLIHVSNDHIEERNQLSVLDTESWEIVVAIPEFERPFREVAVSDDGRLIVTSTADGTLQLWTVSE